MPIIIATAGWRGESVRHLPECFTWQISPRHPTIQPLIPNEFSADIRTGKMRRARHSERGTLLPLLAVMIVVLVLFAGLVIDVGALQQVRGQEQIAADAAAVAGAMEMLPGGNGSSWAVKAAANTAAWNGFSDGAKNTTVTVTPNATTGQVTVQITRNANTYFMNMLNLRTMPVTVTAVAGPGPSPSCLVALNENKRGALTLGGDMTLNCGAYVNSNNSQAVDWQGTAGCLTATSLNVNGNLRESGGRCAGGKYAMTLQGAQLTASTGKPRIGDPLAGSLPAPPETTPCLNNGITYTATQPPPGNVIPAGVYCGTLHINGTPAGGLTFASGTFVIYNGSLIVDNNAVVKSASGGTFFYLTGSTPSSIGNISFSGDGIRANLSAPSTGNYAGLLFWVDGKSTNATPNQVNGQVESAFNGTIYMPSTELLVTGQSSLIDSGNYSIVADTIVNNGQGSIALRRSTGMLASQQVAQLNR